MKQFLYLSLLLALLVSGCNVLPVAEPATATASSAPSSTPEPTLTPLPTDTPTPVPTSTPDTTATALVMATESSSSVLQELDALLGDTDIPYQDGYLAWKQEKSMAVNLSGPSRNYVDVNGDVSGANFVLKSDVTWEASGIIVCGITFRSEPNLEQGKQYQFLYLRLSGLPAWEIDVFQFGKYKNSPSKTQYSNAIDQGNGATNEVVLVGQDEKFTVYINRARQGRYFDYSKQRQEGFFAFMGFQDSGTGSCKFDDSWIWMLK
jgi:hypothetical protein